MNKVAKIAWFATKAGIGGGVVYLTVDQGIWGNGHQASAAYDRLYDIMPGTKSVSEKYLNLPKKEAVNVNFRSYWNTGVFYTFDFLANIPSKFVSLKDYMVDFASSPPAGKETEQLKKAGETVQEDHQAAPSESTTSSQSTEEATPEDITQSEGK